MHLRQQPPASQIKYELNLLFGLDAEAPEKSTPSGYQQPMQGVWNRLAALVGIRPPPLHYNAGTGSCIPVDGSTPTESKIALSARQANRVRDSTSAQMSIAYSMNGPLNRPMGAIAGQHGCMTDGGAI